MHKKDSHARHVEFFPNFFSNFVDIVIISRGFCAEKILCEVALEVFGEQSSIWWAFVMLYLCISSFLIHLTSRKGSFKKYKLLSKILEKIKLIKKEDCIKSVNYFLTKIWTHVIISFTIYQFLQQESLSKDFKYQIFSYICRPTIGE